MSVIQKQATQIAQELSAQKPALEEKASRLKNELAQVSLELKRIDMISQRLATFRVHANGTEQCPRCWIVDEIAADLAPVAGDDRSDNFRCRTCDFEISIPA